VEGEEGEKGRSVDEVEKTVVDEEGERDEIGSAVAEVMTLKDEDVEEVRGVESDEEEDVEEEEEENLFSRR